MNRLEKFSKPMMWLMALLMAALVTGCGGGGGGVGGVVVGGTAAKAITVYSLAGATGVVNEAAKTIAVTVPYGTNVTALVATFTTTGASVKVGAVAQVSGTTPNNFTAPIAYIVTASDGTTATYTVTVTVASITAKAITSFSLAGETGVINEAAKTIAVTVPYGTNVTALAATFTTTGTSVKIGAVAQVSGTTPNNFTASVAYIVTAGDTTTATYIVTVTVAQVSAKAITAFSFAGYPGATGVITEPAHTIAVTVPSGTNVTALVATFATTGTGVKVGAVTQTSAATANNFTAPVAYIVTAADTTTATYTVTVTVASVSAKAITAYSFPALGNAAGVITEPTHTIAVSVLPGSLLNPLVATYTSTGINEKVAGVLQTSGATSNTFTSGVALPYVVTASDLTTATYNVTVTEGAGPVPVPLGTAGNFVILTKTGITDVPTSAITGNIGASPITGASIAGLGCTEVVGKIYTVDAAGPACRTIDTALLTTAIGDMGTAYTNAATRTAGSGVFLNPGAGTLGTGTALAPGLYTFTTAVSITTNLTLNGGPNDVWIFQIPSTLSVSPGVQLALTGGALAKNVFWQVAGVVSLNTTSHFEGVILGATDIAMANGASISGRMLTQTQATLISNVVTQPAP